MKTFSEWRNERLARKRAREVFEYILDQIERGVPVEDMFAFTVDTSVLWSQSEGVWYIRTEERMKPGELVALKQGRGGREENARIVGVLMSECVENVSAYSIRFDVDNVGS